jgi:DMSO/TMAO reductase YedYZ molybdopterin-dependent catalytic subunit
MNERDFKRMSRRELLKLSPVALGGALVFKSFKTKFVESGLRFSDWAGEKTNATRLSETFPDSRVAPFKDFPYNYYDVLDPEIDAASWTLTVDGEAARPGEYTIDQIKGLAKVTQNTRHICIEGWDVIGNFGGARLSDFLNLVGADKSARFIEVYCADDYYSSIDMASARHPQSLLCYEMYGKPLDAGHGAPLRLQMPTKLGYKQANYLVSLRVSNVLGPRKGYWEDMGYSWYGGI